MSSVELRLMERRTSEDDENEVTEKEAGSRYYQISVESVRRPGSKLHGIVEKDVKNERLEIGRCAATLAEEIIQRFGDDQLEPRVVAAQAELMYDRVLDRAPSEIKIVAGDEVPRALDHELRKRLRSEALMAKHHPRT